MPVVDIIPRSEWGAQPTRGEVPDISHPLEKVYVTLNTNSPSCHSREQCITVIQELQKRHIMNDGQPDIAYNFLIGTDGTVYEGRGWLKKPAIASTDENYKDKTLDIAYIGTYEDGSYSLEMYGKFCDILVEGVNKKYLEYGGFKVLETEAEKANISKNAE